MPMRLSDARHASADDHAACRTLLRSGSRSFHAASLLLPKRVYEPAGALYAFCRLADDEIDDAIDNDAVPGSAGRGRPEAALARLRQRLDAAYAGRPSPSPVDRAFADVVRDHAMPRALPEALLEGFAWDAAGRRYETLPDVLAYAARVAGAVGAMMTVLMGKREAATVARACDLGVAMQLSNIARDVGEDARAGRLYLPRSWMRAEGLDPDAWLTRPVFNDAIARVVRQLLDVADSLYDRADAGISRLPLSCRPGIGAARLLYAEIGREVCRRGGDSISSRAVVSGRRKLGLLARSVALSVISVAADHAAPLSETRFLVEAVLASAPRRTGRLQRFEDRFVGVLDLFARLQERDHAAGQVSLNSARQA
jgi:phytoene synthase